MSEAASGVGLEAILNGAAGLGWAAGSVLIVSVDQSLRVVSSVFQAEGETPRGLIAPGRPLTELFPADPLQSIVAPHIAAALTGEAAEVDVAWDDPEILRIRLSFTPRFQGAGRRRGFFLTARNVAPGERRAREADAANARLAAILDNAADGVMLIDESGVIRETNEAGAALFGWTRDQLIGRPVTTLMDPPDQADHQRHIDRYLQTGLSGILNVGPRKLAGRRRDGERVWFELSVGEAWVDGARTFVGVCRDIGERLRYEESLRRANIALEETVFELQRVSADLTRQKARSEGLATAAEASRRRAEEANATKSRFLAAVSHELRTPLNGVLAVTDLLDAQALPAEAQGLIGIIRQSGRDLLGLLNEVLDLAQIEAGALVIAAEPFSPAELIAATTAIWRPAAKAKGLELQVETGPLPDLVLGDAGRLRQVLSNLLNDAIKVTDRGHVRLAATAAVAEGGATLTIVVEDTGPGLDVRTREQLFEPFAQGRGEAGRQGLGLSICREIVGLMRGTIYAEAGRNGGGERMVVEVDLPLTDAAAADVAAEAEVDSFPSALKVLVAEDHPINRQVMALLLDQLGVGYRMAEDGVAAVELASTEPFDLILMDMRMPRMDGLAATRAIRAGGGPNALTPIVAVSADAMPSEEASVLEAGLDAVAPKPLTLASLARAMETALRRKAAA